MWASQVAQWVKNPPAMQETLSSTPGSGKIPWRRAWQPTPVSLSGGLENPMDRGAWWATVHKAVKSLE